MMNKKSLLLLMMWLCSFALQAQLSPKREFRGAWIQCVNYQFMGLGTAEMQRMLTYQLNELQKCGINAILFQVRPEFDALYASSFEPWSRYLTGRQGTPPSPYWDPLQWMIAQCHARGMELHAWINPYRIQVNIEGGTQPPALASEGPYNQWVQDGLVVELPSGRYFNPAMDGVKQLIANGAAEIVQKYGVDGIHFDDYFYPDDFGNICRSLFIGFFLSYVHFTGEHVCLSHLSDLSDRE